MPDPLATPNAVPLTPRPGTPDPAGVHSSVLDLRVRNHPGTMSHITSLFARRAFNLEAILCVPLPGTDTSRMLLLVADEPRVEQLQHQLAKLYDVLEVTLRKDLDQNVFQTMSQLAR